jgi:hypothetical protein
MCCVPQGSSETAAESLLTLDDASALTAAEQLVQQLAHNSSSSSGGSNDNTSARVQQQQQEQPALTDTPAAGAAAAADGMDIDLPQHEKQQQPGQVLSVEQQLLVGRRLLQALISVWGDRSKNNSGKRMCFYAQELNPKLGRARGLDLHSVAERLEAGLYAATEQPLEVCGAVCAFCVCASVC